MLIDLVSTVAVAIGAASIIFIVNHLGGRLLGRRLPKWVMPAGIGAAILGFTVWSEYTWYPRMRDALPEGMVIASAPAESSPFRPWSYAAPIVTRFIAVDREGAAATAADPQVFVANAIIVQRWHSTKSVPQAFDCDRNVRADLLEGATLSVDGRLNGAEWLAAGDDPLVAAACGGG